MEMKLFFSAKGRYSDEEKSNSGKICFTASHSVFIKVKISFSPSRESQMALAALLATCDRRVVLP
jgi:hypothetical protein